MILNRCSYNALFSPADHRAFLQILLMSKIIKIYLYIDRFLILREMSSSEIEFVLSNQ